MIFIQKAVERENACPLCREVFFDTITTDKSAKTRARTGFLGEGGDMRAIAVIAVDIVIMFGLAFLMALFDVIRLVWMLLLLLAVTGGAAILIIPAYIRWQGR